MDPPPGREWKHPEGRWFIENSWSKRLENVSSADEQALRTRYFQPISRWLEHVQNDFAARADWCVKDFAAANHPPVVRLQDTPLTIVAAPLEEVTLNAAATTDPDGDRLRFRWWHYHEAGTYAGQRLADLDSPIVKRTIPADARAGQTIHMICEVTDDGSPPLTRYQRVVIQIGNQ